VGRRRLVTAFAGTELGKVKEEGCRVRFYGRGLA